MPRGTLWVTLGLFLSALISVSVFMIAKEILWAGIAGAGMIGFDYCNRYITIMDGSYYNYYNWYVNDEACMKASWWIGFLWHL